MSDINFNGLGGLNRILKPEGGSRPNNTTSTSGQNLLSQGTGVDSFTRTNPLGITHNGVAAKEVKKVSSMSMEEAAQNVHSSTFDALVRGEFPPIQG